MREGIKLFSATIDPNTGTWVSQQSGTFEVDDLGATGNSLMLKIVAEDKDHDTTNTKVDCTLPATPTVQGLTVLEHGLTSDADLSASAVFEVPAGYTIVGATHTDPDHSNITVSEDGVYTYNLTHATMQKLADKGITFTAGNQVELDGSKGWVHQDSAPGDTHSVWTNASENLSVTTANNEEADNAAKTILLHNS